MEIGIGTQAPPSPTGMRKESTLSKKEIDGFSKLLGFVSTHRVERVEVKQPDSLSLLLSLQGILRATGLDEIGLSSGQLEGLSRLKELDYNQIAEIVGVDIETIKTLFSEQFSFPEANPSLHPSDDTEEDLHEILLSTMQMLHSALKNKVSGLNGNGTLEKVTRLVKVIELLAANRDLLVVEASKASELKDMMKMVQTGVEGSIAKEFKYEKDWSRLIKKASQRQEPVETLNKPSSTEGPAVEKKSIQPIQGNHLHFVHPKTESFSMKHAFTSQNLQVENIETLQALTDAEGQKSQILSELKDMIKFVQTGVDESIAREFNYVKDWSRLMKEAFKRQEPVETLEKHSSTEGITGEKKGIQPIQGNHLHFVLPKTEFVSMSLSSGNRSVQYEQFVKEFHNILSKSKMLSQPNMSKLLIKLYPEQLGSLRIELLQQNGVMTAKILASTATAKEMLDSQIQGLKHAFTSQNLQVEKIEISQALADAERQSKGQSQHHSSQQQKQHQPDQGGSGEEERTQSFKDYLVNTEI
ncbi:flagellar hook-length control protein FliK [Rossellomorea aquimaris]|uniref:flagellar hook-length control protein FliK n=1 Tax=Rossellomorea aquimaris TaxID=189382 RepID=UPI00069747EE|nr:flagellar hook-length control protein FliK [Rossellomorea aquimaris]